MLDEAETAVERKGSARRREFLKFLRFLNDHVANRTDDRATAMVIIGCTDNFWPLQFADYEALRSRLADPGHDSPAERAGLKPKALVRKNKIWVRETFRGDEPDYDGMDFGVVSLLGSSQSKLIWEKLYERLGPDVMQERELRCGEAANFQGDEGLMTITFGNREITTIALETFRNQDYHWVTPIKIPENETATMQITCDEPGTPATGRKARECHEVLNVSGILSSTGQ